MEMRLDVNRAGEDELQALPGVGPALAERIAEHRSRYGPFRTVDALVEVKGVGEATVRALGAYLVAGPERPGQ